MNFKKIIVVFLLVIVISYSSYADIVEDLSSLSLEGMNKNLLLKAANEQFRMRHAKAASGISQWLPNADFKHAFSKSSDKYYGKNKSNQTGLLIRQKIIDAPAMALSQIANVSDSMARVILKDAEGKMLKRLANVYFDTLKASEAIKAAKSFQTLAHKTVALAQTNYRDKIVTINQVFAAEAQHNLAHTKVLGSQQLYKQSLSYLKQISQINFKKISPLKNGSIPKFAKRENSNYWIDKALKGNIQLRALRLNRQVLGLKVKKEFLEHLPKISGYIAWTKGSGSVGTAGAILNSLQSTLNIGDIRYNSWFYGIEIKIPVFHGGYINNKTQEQKHKYRKGLYEYDDLVQKLKLKVSAQYDKIMLYKAELRQYSAEVKYDRAALRIKQKLYQEGKNTSLDIFQYQTRYYKSMIHLNIARYSYMKAMVNLYHMSGQLNSSTISYLNKFLFKKE